MKKTYALLVALLLLHVVSFAQKIDRNYQDVIYLENGNIIRGNILEHIKDQYITIQSSDENTWRFNYEEISRVTIEPIKSIPKNYQSIDKGYSGIVSIAMLVANGNPRYDQEVIPSLQTTQGYYFHPSLFAGLGTGMEIQERGLMLPLYAEFRTNISTKGHIYPHIYLQGGYGFPLHEGRERQAWVDGQWTTEKGDVNGGARFGGGLGIQVLTQQSLRWIFTIGYNFQAYEEVYRGTRFEDERILEEITFQRITFGVGLSY